MQNDEIKFMWKDDESYTEGCPALYETAGGYYVQHKRVTDPDVRARLQALGEANASPLGDDEDWGFVPRNVIDRIREQ